MVKLMVALPIVPAGVTQVRLSPFAATETEVQFEPPTVTVAFARKPEPLSVIIVPPFFVPEVGVTDAIVGPSL